ncbi:MAG: riboflavin synthase [Deltaproteobacteria bacterium]|nr:riboflavin synthase [Deltaproteobacteria bacterium]
MFTGIIEGQGRVLAIQRRKHDAWLEVRPPSALRGVKLGDSIAIDGCCLTVAKKKAKSLVFEVSKETLAHTTLGAYQVGTLVNVERALGINARLGGHIVQGHVDGVGVIQSQKKVRAGKKVYYFTQIQSPKNLVKYLAPKGSIAVDGISLTVNKIIKNNFELCIIPHTQKTTQLVFKKIGDQVNLEVDILAKYLESLLR